jgi:hypothetical protein
MFQIPLGPILNAGVQVLRIHLLNITAFSDVNYYQLRGKSNVFLIEISYPAQRSGSQFSQSEAESLGAPERGSTAGCAAVAVQLAVPLGETEGAREWGLRKAVCSARN